jgi:hypothetical protein
MIFVYRSLLHCNHLYVYLYICCVKVPETLEIGLIPMLKQGQYPGLFLFSNPARMVRPVINLATNVTEMIGSFEQVQPIVPASNIVLCLCIF